MTGLKENRRLAGSHYENFSVGSIFLPKSIRNDLSNIYAFCRIADDIVDEAAEGVLNSDKLDEWERLLDESVHGNSTIPLFAALGDTILRRSLPLQPFKDLLAAFRQDLTVRRYGTWSELEDYCRLSANPVGRLVLAVCGYSDVRFFAYSDKICTALQLTNHWQDIAEDYRRGRIYIPLEEMRKFGVNESVIEDNLPVAEFKTMVLFLCDRAEELYLQGEPLISLAGKPLAPQLYLYQQGGLAALNAIRSAGGDVLTKKCRVRNRNKFWLGAGAMSIWIRGKFG